MLISGPKAREDRDQHHFIEALAVRQALEEPALLAGFGKTLQGYGDEAGELRNISP